MQACLYLFIFLHIAEGCIKNHVQVSITASSGGSVVLPCSCTDPQDKETSLIWRYRKKGAINFDDIYPTDVTKRYGARVQRVNVDTPGNFTISISGLTVEDEGDYQCREKGFMIVHLSVTAGTTRPHGGSKTTPSSQEPHGVSTTTASSSPEPGRNFTISISGLTVEDEGDYECREKNRPHRFIAVHLRAEVNLPFVPFALVTVIILHIIVAVVYCSTSKNDFSRVHYSTADREGRVTLE